MIKTRIQRTGKQVRTKQTRQKAGHQACVYRKKNQKEKVGLGGPREVELPGENVSDNTSPAGKKLM